MRSCHVHWSVLEIKFEYSIYIKMIIQLEWSSKILVRDPIQSATSFPIDLSIFERPLWIRPKSLDRYIPHVSHNKWNIGSQNFHIKQKYQHVDEI